MPLDSSIVNEIIIKKVYTMKKIFLALAAAAFLSTSAYAGSFGVGIAGTILNIDADVTETTTAGTVAGGSANTNKGSVSHDLVPVGAIFAEYTMDVYPITIGVDYTPGSADVSKNFQSRVETPASGDSEGTSTTFKANAEIENLTTLYAEIPVYQNFYAKLGYTEVDVNTDESGMTAYGNSSVDGVTYGVGFSSGSGSGLNYKFAYEAIDFDTVSIKNANGNKVDGDIDTSGFKLSVVYGF